MIDNCYRNSTENVANIKYRRNAICYVMTEQCNLQCKYCYVNQCPQVTTKEVMDKTIDFALDRLNQLIAIDKDSAISIDLFGGEALVERDKVKYMIEQVEKRVPREYLASRQFRIIIFTNCTLLDEDILNFTVKRKFVGFNFSIDGNKASHDATRIYGPGDGSYEDAIKGLETYARIYKKDLWNISTRWTVSPDNIMHLADSARDLIAKGAKKITPFFVREAWTDESIKILDEQMYQLRDLFLKHLEDGVVIRPFVVPIILKQNNANTKPKAFCGAGATHFGISPSGSIYPCQRFITANRGDEFIIGDVFNGIDEDNKWVRFFNNYTTSLFPKCSNCKTFSDPKQCDGQCIAAMFQYNGSLTNIVEAACRVNEVILKHADEVYEILKDNPMYISSLDRDKW